MSEYVRQAKDFLESCNATMEIEYVGIEKPNWDDKPHRTYDCKITTPKGKMMVHFYDSTANTELWMISDKEYYEKKFRRYYDGLTYQEKIRWLKNFKEKREKAIPTEYDILACLQKYDVGDMDDFMSEFGYEIKCTKDMTDFINTYNAVVKEYNDVRRCFTEKQIEVMREIQ